MTVARSVLRTRARALADQDDSDFPTDTQYDTWLDVAKVEVYYDLLAAGWSPNYTTTTVTANGATSYTLASGAQIATVQSVCYSSNGQWIPLPRYDA